MSATQRIRPSHERHGQAIGPVSRQQSVERQRGVDGRSAGEPTPDVSAVVADIDGRIITSISRHTEQHTEADAAGCASAGCAAQDGPVAVVAIAGEIDQDTVCLVDVALTSAIRGNDRVCCDLSRVEFLSAAGINTVLAAHRYAAVTGHRFSVRGARGITRRVLEITELHRVLISGP